MNICDNELAAPAASHVVRIRVAEGLSLCADVIGASDAPTILFAHGAGQTRQSWRAAPARLAACGYRIVNIDLRGHGDSDWGDDYALSAFADDISAVLRWCGRPAILVGASMGASSSLLAAAAKPERVLGLVLVDMAPRAERDGILRILEFMRRNVDAGFASLEEAAGAVRAYNRHRTKAPSPEGLRKNLRLRDGRYYWHWDPRFLDHRDGRSNRMPLEAAAAAIDRPTLLVRGAFSDVVSDASVAHLRELIPHLEVREVAAGHMVGGDRNDIFVESLEDFLRSHFPTPG